MKTEFRITDVNRKEFKDMAVYLEGLADGLKNEKLKQAAAMLMDAGDHICAQGYYGCSAGLRCTSDHK